MSTSQRRQTASNNHNPKAISNNKSFKNVPNDYLCKKLYTSIQRCRKMSTLDVDVHVWVGGAPWMDRVRVLDQVLLYPGDDVARFVEWLAVDEQAGNLAFSADGDERLLGIGVGRDIALGNGHAVIGQKVLDPYAIRAAGHNVQCELVISSHGSPIG